MSIVLPASRRVTGAPLVLVAATVVVTFGLPACSSRRQATVPTTTTTSVVSTATIGTTAVAAVGASAPGSPPSSGQTVAESATTATQQTTTTVRTTTTLATGSLGPVPETLDALEASAEDVIDLVPDKGWGQIARDVETMQATWTEFRDQATTVDAGQADRVGQALGKLSDAARIKAGPGTAQAANDVSGPIIELSAHYDLPRPVQIGRLDVLGRQIVLDSDRRDLAAAAAQVAEARVQWGDVKAGIIEHDGADVAARADGSLVEFDGAIERADAASLRSSAVDFLEIVDAMERLF